MFFADDRLMAVRQMIVANTDETRQEALDQILPMQKDDFKAILRIMHGLPVTIRLLDPPLHEFLPQALEEIGELAAYMRRPAREVRRRVEDMRESNPMLGHRGCRLGITDPDIYRMQVRAMMEAACELKARGHRGGARNHGAACRPRRRTGHRQAPHTGRGRAGDAGSRGAAEVSHRHHDRTAPRRPHRRRHRPRGGVFSPTAPTT